MSGSEFFKFNKEKGVDFTQFKLKLNGSSEAEKKRDALFSIFDKDENGELDGEEASSFLGAILGYAGIKDDICTLDSDEAEMFLSLTVNAEGESLKDAGFSVSDVFDFASQINTICSKVTIASAAFLWMV